MYVRMHALHFVKAELCLLWFSTPPFPSHLSKCLALFAVAEEWLLLDIGRFVLFLSNKKQNKSFECRVTDTLRRPQTKQDTASNEELGSTEPMGHHIIITPYNEVVGYTCFAVAFCPSVCLKKNGFHMASPR